MKIKNTISKIMLFSALTVLTASANAAVGHHTTQWEHRHGVAGTTTKILTAYSNHICFLSRVKFADIDAAGETARCEVRRSGNNWVLDASLGSPANNSSAECSAICFNHN